MKSLQRKQNFQRTYIVRQLTYKNLCYCSLLQVPAEEAVEYELVDFPLRDFYEHNPYVGDPRPEHDEAWGKLLKSRLHTTFLRNQEASLTILKT